ncbi:MAG: hypothetical protein Q7R62_02800 [bacterium]|nr:hypothetical protein [bacterium]
MQNLQPTTYNLQPRRGQIMILTTLILSGTILAAVTIAGLLMLYQIRQAGNAMQSGRAIFVADAGLEYELYKFYSADCAYPKPTFNISPVTLYSTTTISGNDVLFVSNSLAGKTTRGLSLRFINLAPEEHCVSFPTSTPS